MGGTYYNQTIAVVTPPKQVMFANAAALSSGIAANGHIVAQGIYFDTAKAVLKPESAPALQEIAKLLSAQPQLKLYVVGHTDNAGTLQANMELSRQRAAAVVKALTGQYGVAPARLQPYGDGPYAPVASNDSEDGRAQNRRVELVKQ
jgi:outer membrane protein OmpA-like peptidoglycan-associated protein